MSQDEENIEGNRLPPGKPKSGKPATPWVLFAPDENSHEEQIDKGGHDQDTVGILNDARKKMNWPSIKPNIKPPKPPR